MAKATHWGATAGDWDALSLLAGLTPHLLPVVSNPGARIDPDSKLKALGKVPSLYNQHGFAVGIANWPEKVSTHRDIERWRGVSDYGISVNCRAVRALDIDIDDRVATATAVEIFAGALNFAAPLPVRSRENSGKILLAFYLDGEFTKRILTTAQGNIEFLASGQQFVAVGTHPSGVRYRWHDGGTGEEGLPLDFPTLSREQFEAGWAALMHHLAIDEVVEYGRGRTLKEQRRAVGVHDDTAEFLKDRGWVKSTSRDGRLNIRCPFEHEHSGPSADDTATQYLPAGVGGFEVGHFHCLHAHCAGRCDTDFREQIGMADEMFEPIPETPRLPGAPPPPPDGLQRSPDGTKILTHLTNIVTALRASEWLGFEVALDRFRDALMIRQAGATGSNGWRVFTDADYSRARMALHSKGLRAVGAELVKDAVVLVAEENAFDSAIIWLNEIVPDWDGVPRVASFYPEVFGSEDEPYARACGLYTWTALAGRILEPGCKADMVPILKGDQGLGKSETIAAIAPDRAFFTELDLAAHDDNMSRMMRGRLVVEFGELRGLHTKDQEAIKSFITRRWENWVPKFREFSTTFPRRCLFFGTTNKDMFLADHTGNRRWLPIEVTAANPEWVEMNRLQLWAEARDLWLAGGIQFQEAQRLATAKHAAHMITDSWDTPVREWLGLRENGGGARPVRICEILHGALGFEARNISRVHEMRVADCLRVLGYARKKMRVQGELGWYWVPKGVGVSE